MYEEVEVPRLSQQVQAPSPVIIRCVTLCIVFDLGTYFATQLVIQSLFAVIKIHNQAQAIVNHPHPQIYLTDPNSQFIIIVMMIHYLVQALVHNLTPKIYSRNPNPLYLEMIRRMNMFVSFMMAQRLMDSVLKTERYGCIQQVIPFPYVLINEALLKQHCFITL